MMTPIERAIKYIDNTPGAVSGNGGHNQAFSLACHLFKTFGFDESTVFDLMRDYYNGKCDPPWTDKELKHKVTTACQKVGPVHVTTPHYYPSSKPGKDPFFEPATELKPIKHVFKASGRCEPLPTEEIEDGTRLFLKSAFREGEGVRIVHARLDDEGRETVSKGVTLSREEWLRMLDENKGDVNRIFDAAGNPGIYVAVNPLKVGGSKDSDVQDFRHVLLEFDNISKSEQWNLYRLSDIPCTAIIDSGGKSIHAWVRVDAKDRKEYGERVELLYRYFEEHEPDIKNKNPGRLSRLPNCVRKDGRQKLLALNVGKESFTEWMTERELDGIGKPLSISKLVEFDPEEDPNNLLGKRWLCKGGSCLWVGQAGIGKSSLLTQATIRWGLGRDFFGVYPVKQIKSLIIQAENDEGDIAEQVQGVLAGLEIDPSRDTAEMDLIDRNVVYIRDTIHVGEQFAQVLRRLIDRHKPDLVWIDPLLSFIGADISKQEVCSHFLRNLLNPIAEATGVVFMCVHHTGKPPSDSKARSGWTTNDYAYLGLGSSELTNWARAVCSLMPVTDAAFQMKFAKRGNRAGIIDDDFKTVTSIWLKHSEKGLNWIQTEKPEGLEDNKGASGGNGKPGRTSKRFPFEKFFNEFADVPFPSTKKLVEAAMDVSGIGKSSIYDKWIDEIKSMMKQDPETKAWIYEKPLV